MPGSRDATFVTAASFLLAALAAACVAPKPAWMTPQAPRSPSTSSASSTSAALVEVAHAEPPPGHRVLLVAYPKTACSGSASTVLMDETGRFIGALAPGEGTLLVLPEHMRTVMAVSSVEIAMPFRTRFSFNEITVPAPPDAILLEASRVNARQCSRTGQYASASIVPKGEIEARLADEEIVWLEPRLREGQAWLDAHRERVDELLGRKPPAPPRIVHHRGEPTAP